MLCSHERNDVWVMKEYMVKESQTELYTIKCPNDVLSPPICMSFGSEILHVLNSSLMIYNLQDDLMRYLEVTNVYTDAHLEAELYIESLFCPVFTKQTNQYL